MGALGRRAPARHACRLAGVTTIMDRLEGSLLEEKRSIEMDEARELVELPAAELPRLLALAHEVRRRWWGEGVELESLISAQTGGCPEDCAFCSQSMHYDAPAHRHAFLPLDQVLAAARATEASGASAFCIVVAVRGPDRRLMGQVLRAIEAIHAQTALDVDCSLGILTRAPGRGPARRRRAPLQPQPGDGPQLLPGDRHHAHLGGARRDLPPGHRARDEALQRGHPGDGGDLGAAPRVRLRAARAGPRRDPDELPQPAPRARRWRGGGRWRRTTRCAPSPSSGSCSRTASSATPAGASWC